MKELMRVTELQVGDTIDTSLGYAYTITDIEIIKPKFGTPDYILTVYSNRNDKKDLFKVTYAFNQKEYVIARNFEYEPQFEI